MTLSEFETAIAPHLRWGITYDGPRNGLIIIRKITANGSIHYQCREGNIYVAISDLYNAYSHFAGKQCTSTNLRELWPNVFDSSCCGHSCNCILFFRLLIAAGLADGLHGKGVAHHPCYVNVADD